MAKGGSRAQIKPWAPQKQVQLPLVPPHEMALVPISWVGPRASQNTYGEEKINCLITL